MIKPMRRKPNDGTAPNGRPHGKAVAAPIPDASVRRVDPRGRVRVAVAAQPALFREILSNQLERETTLTVVGCAAAEDQIEEMLLRDAPTVLVFDYEGLGPNAESTIHRLRRVMPGTRVLVLASRSGDETVQRVLRAGASGLVGKHLEFKSLVRAIHALSHGEVWADRRATCAALEDLTDTSDRSILDLTRREHEIADACSRGFRNKEIASRLQISEKTVKGHLNNIFRKLRVDNRLELALQVLQIPEPRT
jgi:DNA-binding NarL/FixJ family response regulator